MKTVFEGLAGKTVRVHLTTRDSVIGIVEKDGIGAEHVVIADTDGTRHHVPYAHIVEFYEQPESAHRPPGFR